ncbi:protein eva-1 homolog C-like [Mytilus californianus]|uniref:protein eva-1 homolog C-like n=1 Tax=Mytilus californianus TaxID=6549 RepID=UPI002245BC7A|nr:protein eva-1 homolog C-like [Mytilus californianus]
MFMKILFVFSIFVAAVYGATKLDGVDGDVLTLECGSGSSIDVKSAFYGNNNEPACGDANALTTLQGLTDGKQSYDLAVNSDTFTSDCDLSRDQTFTIKYDCISTLLTQTSSQGDTSAISCTNGKKIKTINAEYKFKSKCLDPNALTVVQGLCDDETSCSVGVSDTVFANSDCDANQPETLSISYKCIAATGPVYTRYGASGCSVTAAVVYKGIMAGAKHDGSGSGSNYQCLTSTPTYDTKSGTENSERGYIYGMEIKLDTIDSTSVIDISNDESTIDCTVCQVISSKSVFMVAGLDTCPSGYASEYGGYLASDSTDGTTSKSYICLDKAASYAGATSNNQGLLYLTEIRCGSLSCSTYTDNAEIPCVVCSRAVTST